MGNMLFSNNATSKLASGITAVSTTLTLASGTGVLFPTIAGSQYFKCTLSNVAGTITEIVKVTGRTGDVLTVVRAQEGTSAYAFSLDDKVELRATADTLANFGQLDSSNTWTQAQTFNVALSPSSGGTGLASYTTGDIIGVALDLDAGTLTFYKNNVSQGAISLSSFTTANFTIATARGSGATQYSAQAQIDDINDLVTCTISATVGASIPAGSSYVYDVQIKTASNITYTLLTGTITVTQDVTGRVS